jgi:hypothetical protein
MQTYYKWNVKILLLHIQEAKFISHTLLFRAVRVHICFHQNINSQKKHTNIRFLNDTESKHRNKQAVLQFFSCSAHNQQL